MAARAPVAVLMYHALLAGPPAAGVHPVHIGVEAFAGQLAWLHAQGYVAVSVAELAAGRRSGPPPGARLVAITFDDGYLSLLDHAAPLLARYGFRATLFLTTGFVGQPDFTAAPDFAPTTPPGDRPLTWAEVRALRDAGWAIEAHSHRHRPHANLAPAGLRQELAHSRDLIGRELGHPPRFYAFPYGSYDRHALRALAGAGYRAGFSVHGGLVTPASDGRRLPRLEINTSTALRVFEKLVRTGYASPAEKYRARLRDALFHYPVLKDGIQKALVALESGF